MHINVCVFPHTIANIIFYHILNSCWTNRWKIIIVLFAWFIRSQVERIFLDLSVILIYIFVNYLFIFSHFCFYWVSRLLQSSIFKLLIRILIFCMINAVNNFSHLPFHFLFCLEYFFLSKTFSPFLSSWT